MNIVQLEEGPQAGEIRGDSLALRKGIVLTAGSGTRLFPMTHSVSKGLMPVYDKPMIYYSLSVLMLAGVRDILVITSPHELGSFERLLGDGSQWGLQISYVVQSTPEGLSHAFILGEEFMAGEPVCMVLGDNLLYGQDLSRTLQSAARRKDGGTVFGYYTKEPERYGVVDFGRDGRALSIEEKPANPKSNYAIPGVYFFDGRAAQFAKELTPSDRGELEISDLIMKYLERDELRVEIMGRGTAWLDTGSPDTLAEATEFVRVIQHRQGVKISCPEEIAFRQGRITRERLEESIRKYAGTSYGQYLASL